MISPDAELAIVQNAFPDLVPVTYIPPHTSAHASEFVLNQTHRGDAGTGHAVVSSKSVFVDPYRGVITGEIDTTKTPYAVARKIHATLLLGQFGDYVLETAAGFGVLLAMSGLTLWMLKPAPRPVSSATAAGRGSWNRLHRQAGVLLFAPMLFFFLSGLAWTPLWGGKLVQAWSSFPVARLTAPIGQNKHESMDHGDHRQTPWALAKTPMPISSADTAVPLSLGRLMEIAADKGVKYFRINFPAGDAGVWTISSTTISGDLKNPRQERTIHIDQYSGDVVADVGFSSYSVAGKLMAAAIPLHQADLGTWNIAINLIFCVGVIVMIVSATGMWRARAGKEKIFALPPPATKDDNVNTLSAAISIGLSLLFPLTAAALIAIVIFDLSVRSRKKDARSPA